MRFQKIFIVLIILFANPVQATIYEIINNDCNIQEVVSQTSQGDTILIHPGIYHQRIRINEHGLTLASLDLYGNQNPPAVNTTILQGEPGLGEDGCIIVIDGPFESDVKIIGLTISDSNVLTQDGSANGAGIRADSVTITISGNRILNNVSEYDAGMYLDECISTIENNYFAFNQAYMGGGFGLYSGQTTIKNNFFESNANLGMEGAGFRTNHGCSGSILENHFRDNSSSYDGGGIGLITGNWNIYNNIFENNFAIRSGAGIFASFCDTINIRNNIFLKNVVEDDMNTPVAFGSGVHISVIYDSSYVFGNTFIGNYSRERSVLMVQVDSAIVNKNIIIGNQSRTCSGITVSQINNNTPFVTITNNLLKFNIWREDVLPPSFYLGTIFCEHHSTVEVHENDFYANENIALASLDSILNPATVNCAYNYWGHSSGPSCSINPEGLGDTVSSNLDPRPFSSESFWDYGLEFDRDVYDFGYIQPGESASINVSMTNVTDEELIIYKLMWLNENVFISPSMDSLLIFPNESITIPVTFSPDAAVDYFDVLTTVAFDHRASGSTIEFIGSGIYSDVEENSAGIIPTTFNFSQASPNPFNNTTSFNFFLPDPGYLNIVVYNINGQVVKDLNRSYYHRGKHIYSLNMNDQSSGIYFIEADYGGRSIVRKVVLIQ